MGAQNSVRVLTEALIAADPFETLGSSLIVRPLQDDTGSLQVGNGATSFDFRIVLGANTNYILADRGAQKLTLNNVTFESNGTVNATTINVTDINITGNTTGVSVNTDPLITNALINNTFLNTATLNVSSAASVGSLSTSGLVNAANVVSAGVVNGVSITASGTLSGNVVESTTHVNGATITASGTLSGNVVESTTHVNGVTITASGTLSGNVVESTTHVNGATITASGTLSGNVVESTTHVNGVTITASGAVSGDTVTATNDVNGAKLSITGNATVGTLITNEAISQHKNYGSAHVVDQGSYMDFNTEAGIFYWVNVRQINGSVDNNNVRVNFPPTPSFGDKFAFGISIQANQAGSFAAAPGYCLEPANNTVIRGETYTAEENGKWSLWMTGEYLKFIWVGFQWQLYDDGRIPFNGKYARATDLTESPDAAWFKADFDNKVFDVGNSYDTSNKMFVIKRAGKYQISTLTASLLTINDQEFYFTAISNSTLGNTYVQDSKSVSAPFAFQVFASPLVLIECASGFEAATWLRSNVANAGLDAAAAGGQIPYISIYEILE